MVVETLPSGVDSGDLLHPQQTKRGQQIEHGREDVPSSREESVVQPTVSFSGELYVTQTGRHHAIKLKYSRRNCNIIHKCCKLNLEISLKFDPADV